MAGGRKKADRAGVASKDPSRVDTPQGPVGCAICDKLIIEASDGVPGDDALQCEGACGGWMHRCCAGVSLSHYASLSASEDPFYCAVCCQQSMRETIRSLQDTVSALKSEIAQLKAEKSSSQSGKVTLNAAHDNIGSKSLSSNASKPALSLPILPRETKRHPRSDKKYNLVIYGIRENQKGTQRHIRSANDIKAATSILTSIHSTITEHSVIDCTRLGKFSEDRCRPTLVTMIRPNDVATILANRVKLSQMPHISIKPDLSAAERKVESILLKERRKLISSGTPRSHIKLSKGSLFVHNREYGKVVDSTFLQCPLISDFVSATLSVTAPDAEDPGCPHVQSDTMVPSGATSNLQSHTSIPQPHTLTSQPHTSTRTTQNQTTAAASCTTQPQTSATTTSQ